MNVRRIAWHAIILLLPVAGLAAETPAMLSPTVTWVQPVNNALVGSGSQVILQTAPSETGGTIAQVVYSISGRVIGTASSAPWQVTWTPTAQGTFSISALALDSANHGASAVINITVGPPGVSTSGPKYSLTVVNGSGSGSYYAGASVNVSATPPAGQIFQSWSGTAVLASSPASFTYTMPSGNTVLTANCVNPVTPVLSSVAPTQLPLGVFSTTITGTGFGASSVVSLGSAQLAVTSFTPTTLNVTGFSSASGPANITVANGPAVSNPIPVQVGVPNPVISSSAARRFLEQAAFGPSPADAAHLQAIGFQAWLNEQFAMPAVTNYSAANPLGQSGMSTVFLSNAVTNPDQLRQRVAFALSQIFVTSLMKLNWNSYMIPYQQMLLNDAFTNYRQILGDVTLSPAMGWYLDMVNNAAASPSNGTAPNENYAREVMQLFSVGTKMLNSDGTVQKDSAGVPIPVYNQSHVREFARVFTGWGFTSKTSPGTPVWGALLVSNSIDTTVPMSPYMAAHDYGPKALIGTCQNVANLAITQDLNAALDCLANHPNTAPFISKQLIQHLVKSNPSPAYVARVAAVFVQSGGDMKAVVTAILLDQEARANDAGYGDQPADGHLQEPALFLPGFIRAFAGINPANNNFASNISALGEDIFNPASVFSYFSPSNVVSGTGGLLGPEFQLYTANAAVLRENLIASFFSSYSNPVMSYGPTMVDLSPFVPLAATPSTLVDALDLTLTHGTMPAPMKQILVNAVAGDTGSALHRVETGVYLILTSIYYNVWH
jgi:uncharacterized protein (DUF1800 family)